MQHREEVTFVYGGEEAGARAGGGGCGNCVVDGFQEWVGNECILDDLLAEGVCCAGEERVLFSGGECLVEGLG